MEVYIEYVILDNLTINTLILLFTAKTLNFTPKKWQYFLSSLLGTVFAVFLPLITINTTIMFLLKILLGIFMVLIIKPKTTIKQLILSFTLFITYTFALGGLCFGIIYMFNFNTTFSGIILNGFEIPISIFILLIFTYLYFLLKTIQILHSKKRINNYSYTITLLHNDKTYTLNGFVDTGNTVYVDCQPLTIMSLSTFNKIFKENTLSILANPQTCGYLSNPKYINIKSIQKNNQILTFTLDKLTIYHQNKITTHNNPVLGLSATNFNNQFDCLLHVDLL